MYGNVFERRQISRLFEVDVHTETEREDSLGQGRILVPEMPWFLQAQCREMRRQSTLSWLDAAEEKREALIEKNRKSMEKPEQIRPEAQTKTAVCTNCGKQFNYDNTDSRKFIYHACGEDLVLFAMDNPNLKGNGKQGKYRSKAKWQNFGGD